MHFRHLQFSAKCAKCQPHFRSTLYYPAMRTGTAVSDVEKVAVFQFRRTSVGSGLKYSDKKFLLRPQVETDF